MDWFGAMDQEIPAPKYRITEVGGPACLPVRLVLTTVPGFSGNKLKPTNGQNCRARVASIDDVAALDLLTGGGASNVVTRSLTEAERAAVVAQWQRDNGEA